MGVQSTEFTLVLSFINYCVIFHVNNCKPAFAPPCTHASRATTSQDDGFIQSDYFRSIL